MSDNNLNEGMEPIDQPDFFEMTDDTEEGLTYEPFMTSDYEVSAEDHSEQEQEPDADFNFDDEESGKSTDDIENSNTEDDLDFEDEKASQNEDEFKAEDAIAKLEKLGFKIEKDGVEDPLKAKEFEIQELEKHNSIFESCLKKNDLELCRESVTEEIIQKWTNEGRKIDLNSEEFKMEVEYEMSQYEDNPKLAKLQANQVKQIFKEAISKNEQKKNQISTEVREARDKELRENRIQLQNSFKEYNGKTLFGQKITADHLKQAYKSITNGDFTSQVENDRKLQAEFALYLQFRENLSQQGGRTYNEGVAATVRALQGNGPKVESSLVKTVSRGGAASILDRATAWKASEQVERKQ